MPGDPTYWAGGQIIQDVGESPLDSFIFYKSVELRDSYRVACNIVSGQVYPVLWFLIRIRFFVLLRITSHQKFPSRDLNKSQKGLIGQEPGICTETRVT